MSIIVRFAVYSIRGSHLPMIRSAEKHHRRGQAKRRWLLWNIVSRKGDETADLIHFFEPADRLLSQKDEYLALCAGTSSHGGLQRNVELL